MSWKRHLSSKIQSIYFELPNFSFYHSPSGREDKETSKVNFIGREKLHKRIYDVLANSNSKSGAYLVTGFRGMGKTSLVRKVISKYKYDVERECENLTNKNKVIDIELNLAQDDLKDIELLKQLAQKIHTTFVAHFYTDWKGKFWQLRYEIATLISITLSIISWLTTMYTNFNFPFQDLISSIPYIVLSILMLIALYELLNYVKGLNHIRTNTIIFYSLISFIALSIVISSNSILLFESVYSSIWKVQVYSLLASIAVNVLILNIACKISERVFIKFNSFYRLKLFRQIELLNQKITAQVKDEKGGNINIGSSLIGNFITKRTVVTPIANAKEIEKELLSFLENLNKNDKNYSKEWTPPQYIVVLDELDKISTTNDYSIEEKEASDPNLNSNELFSTSSIRSRQETIAKLLSNLKHFLNVAQAKFIFIAGREMYDATLADISDRESFFGSIFHGVFYVESFYKDQLIKPSFGIEQMIETYLCKLLIPIGPEEDNKKTISINDYHNYLYKVKNCYTPINISNDYKADFPDSKDNQTNYWKKQQIEKIISTLQNYIVYLTYRSNGMPKKLISLIESNIISYQRNEFQEIKDKSGGLWVVRGENVKENDKIWSEKKVFLKLDFEDQYVFGLNASLIRPYMIMRSRYVRSFGDKLLVSTTYLMNHLFKFHRDGFSWRNIELAPEVIAFNKAPELRSFIDDILKFLSNSFLREAHFGLYRFKFFKSISDEIDFVSKINETENAAYNFTLDESILIKKHYHKKLKELESKQHLYITNNNDQHIHSVGFVNSILGDLYFYDREYDNAIIHYANSIQTLRKISMDKIGEYPFYIYLKDKLKLMLSLEKMHVYEASTVHAIDLVNEVYEFFISNMKDGKKNNSLIKKIEKTDEFKEHYFSKTTDSSLKNDKYTNNESDLKSLFDYKYEKSASIFYNLPLIVSVFINELVMIEKSTPTGVTYQDYLRNFGKFQQIIGFNSKERAYQSSFLKSIYYHHLGTILFFKNGSFFDKKFNTPSDLKTDIKYRVDKRGNTGNDYKSPISAYYSYCISLNSAFRNLQKPNSIKERKWRQLKELFPTELNDTFPFALAYLDTTAFETNFESLTRAELENIGTLFSKLGDCVIDMVTNVKGNFFCIEFLNTIFDSYHKREVDQDYSGINTTILRDQLIRLNKECILNLKVPCLNVAIYYFTLSGLYYRMAGRYNSYTKQLIKQLYLFKDYLSVNDYIEKEFNLKIKYCNGKTNNHKRCSKEKWENHREVFLEFLLKSVGNIYMTKVIRTSHWTRQTTSRPQILKLENTLGYPAFETSKIDSRSIYPSISTGSDQKEIVILFSDLLLKAFSKGNNFHYEKMTEYFNLSVNGINSYSSISSQFVRILELNFKQNLNLRYLELISLKDKIDLLDKFRFLSSETLNLKQSTMIKEWETLKDNIVRLFHLPSEHEIKHCNLFNLYFSGEPDIDISKYKIDMFQWINKRILHRNFLEQKEIFDQLKGNEFNNSVFDELTTLNSPTGINQLGKFLIEDSLSALFEMVSILNTHGVSYMFSNTFHGFTRKRLGTMCRYFHYYKKICGDDETWNISNSIAENIGHHMDPKYHHERAITHFKNAIEMHYEGRTYRSQLSQLYYLEDDFNDDMYHFSAAMERYKINSGLIRKEISDLKQDIIHSRLHRYDSYMNTEIKQKESQ